MATKEQSELSRKFENQSKSEASVSHRRKNIYNRCSDVMKQEMNERDVSPCNERASQEKILNSFHLSYFFIITLTLRFRY